MSHTREVKDLTKGSIGKPLVNLAIPLLGTSFIQMLYSFTDIAWLGRLGSEAVAATGAASVFIWIAHSLSFLNKVGSEVLVGSHIGMGAKAEASHFAGHASTLGLFMGTLLLIIYFTLAPPLLSVYQLAASIHKESVKYLQIVSLGLPLIFMIMAFTGTYNASGHSKVPFILSAIGLILNMLLDPIFIFQLDMGVAGAAIATVIAQSIVLLLFLYQISIKDKLLGGIKVIQKLKRSYTIQIIKVGTPVAVMNSLFAFLNMILGRYASLYGGHIGVMTITTGGQLEGISWNTAQGFSTALSAFVAQNFGAQRIDRAYKAFYFTLLLSCTVGIFATLIYYFGGEKLFDLIVPESNASQAGAVYLRIQSFVQIFTMIEVTCQGFFYGIRKTLPPSLISIIGNFIRIPVAMLLLPIYQDITILWWIIAISSLIKGVAGGIWYIKEKKHLKKSASITL